MLLHRSLLSCLALACVNESFSYSGKFSAELKLHQPSTSAYGACAYIVTQRHSPCTCIVLAAVSLLLVFVHLQLAYNETSEGTLGPFNVEAKLTSVGGSVLYATGAGRVKMLSPIAVKR